MTTVGQHPGFEIPRRSTTTSSTWLRVALAMLALALVAGVGYLAYEAATEEAAPQTFEQSTSVEAVQDQIDMALIRHRAGVSSVDVVNAQIAGALMGLEAGPGSVDILNAEIIAAKADLLGGPGSVEIVQGEIERQLEELRLAGFEDAWIERLEG